MSMRGGYQIINLDNVPFNSSDMNAFTYREMYYNLLNSNSKLIILSGLNMDGVKYADNDVVFYEVEGVSNYPIFQAVIRLTWNQAEHTCTTRYVNIQSAEEEPYSWKDAKVWLSADTIIYEDVDQELNAESEKAIANGAVTREFLKYLPLSGGTMTGTINMNSNKIENVYTPKNPTDAANKKYVDFKTKSLVIVSNAQSTESSPNHGGYAIVNRYGNTLDIYFHIDTLSNDVTYLSFVFASDVLTELHATRRNVFTYVKVEPPGSTDIEVHYSELTINNNDITINLNAGGGSGLGSGFAYSGHVMLVV